MGKDGAEKNENKLLGAVRDRDRVKDRGKDLGTRRASVGLMQIWKLEGESLAAW